MLFSAGRRAAPRPARRRPCARSAVASLNSIGRFMPDSTTLVPPQLLAAQVERRRALEVDQEQHLVGAAASSTAASMRALGLAARLADAHADRLRTSSLPTTRSAASTMSTRRVAVRDDDHASHPAVPLIAHPASRRDRGGAPSAGGARGSRLASSCDHRHRAMAPAGAADRHREVGLALALGARQARTRAAPAARSRNSRASALSSTKCAHRRRPRPSSAESASTKYGLGRKRTSSTMSASAGRPCLKPNDSSVTASTSADAAVALLDDALELVHVQVAGVDDRRRPPRAGRRRISRSRAMPCAQVVARQRVAPARLGEAAHQHVVGGVEEQHLERVARACAAPRTTSR